MIKVGKPSWPVAKTLFHELGHNTDENHREGIQSKRQLEDAGLGRGRFYEFANTVFERLVGGGNFYKKGDAMQLSESGYGPLAPLGSMLASALGFSEIEFARIKDKGKAYGEQLLEKMFPTIDGADTPCGSKILEKAKKIFDAYQLDTDFSLGKKIANQNLLNEMYAECLEIMKKRIEIELQRGNIQNLEEYKKYQMFFLKKMNVNFKSASKSDGFIFSRTPITNDIGFCTDKISRRDLTRISAEQLALVDFGFDNSTLGKYSRVMTTKRDNKSFFETLKFSVSRPLPQTKSAVSSIEDNQTTNDSSVHSYEK